MPGTATRKVGTGTRQMAQALKISNHDGLTRLGHEMTWSSRHGVPGLAKDPGYKGQCSRCGGTFRIVELGCNMAHFEAVDADGKHVWGGRRCPKRRRR